MAVNHTRNILKIDSIGDIKFTTVSHHKLNDMFKA